MWRQYPESSQQLNNTEYLISTLVARPPHVGVPGQSVDGCGDGVMGRAITTLLHYNITHYHWYQHEPVLPQPSLMAMIAS